MPLFDLALIIIIGSFALFGLWFGLFHTLGSLIGTVLGVYLASRYYIFLAQWLTNITGWTGNFPKVIAFIIVFLIINRLIGFLFYILDGLFSIVTHLPFISGLNRLLGLIFGTAEGIIVLGIVLFFINKFPLGPAFMTAFAQSKIAPFCIQAASILWPLIPVAIKMLQDALKGII